MNPAALPIDPKYKPMFTCDCGQPAEFRLAVQFHMLYKRNGVRPTELDSYRVSNKNLYLCPACLEKERRQQQGYST